MAVITENTFNPLLRYVGVRLQQGVAIVDADVNEREDARQFEVRAFLKWFVGNGVPEGNDGFRIEGTGLANDFHIRAGAPKIPAGVTPTDVEKGLAYVGRCLVDGQDVLITDDVRYSTLPAPKGAPALAPLQTPTTNAPLLAYLDVWTRLITPTEEPKLIHPGLGAETCARYKREWTVRWRAVTTPGVYEVPKPGDGDFVAGHSYYALAAVTRRTGDAAVNAADVLDLREERLLVPPSTLVPDTLGVSMLDYRRGVGRPSVSLREAINALLRGELLASADLTVNQKLGIASVGRGYFLDNNNGLIAVWTTDDAPAGQHFNKLLGSRLDLNKLEDGFTKPAVQLSPDERGVPYGTALPNGDLLVTYQGVASGSTAPDIYYKRGATLAALAAAPEVAVAATPSGEFTASVTVSGDFAVFIFFDSSINALRYRRLRHATNAWEDSAPQTFAITASPVLSPDNHVARDESGRLWVASRSGGGSGGIRVFKFNPANKAVEWEKTITTGNASDVSPTVVPLSGAGSGAYVFWRGDKGPLYALLLGDGTGGTPLTVPGITTSDVNPFAVRDGDYIWFFHSRAEGLNNQLLLLKMFNTKREEWGESRPVTNRMGSNSPLFAVQGPSRDLSVFWTNVVFTTNNIFCKRITTGL
jgi:hypothetical protein